MSKRRLSDVLNAVAPASFQCAISMTVMHDPVIDADGYTYERALIEEWLGSSAVSPMTRLPLTIDKLVPNRALRNSIQELAEKLLEENHDIEDDWTGASNNFSAEADEKMDDNSRSEEKSQRDGMGGAIQAATSSSGHDSRRAASIRGEPDTSLRHNAAIVIRTSHHGKRICLLQSEVERILHPLRSIQHGDLKGGNGTTFRALNTRDNVIRGLTVQCTDELFNEEELKTCRALGGLRDQRMLEAWNNPWEYAKEGDFRVGDELHLIDYNCCNMYHRVPFTIQEVGPATGWNIDKEAIRVGRSGLVGDYWKELHVRLKLEIPSDMLDGGIFLWCDAVKLDCISTDPDVVFFKDQLDPSIYTVSTSGEKSISELKILFETTDLHQLDISTFRDGGGLHIDIFTMI